MTVGLETLSSPPLELTGGNLWMEPLTVRSLRPTTRRCPAPATWTRDPPHPTRRPPCPTRNPACPTRSMAHPTRSTARPIRSPPCPTRWPPWGGGCSRSGRTPPEPSRRSSEGFGGALVAPNLNRGILTPWIGRQRALVDTSILCFDIPCSMNLQVFLFTRLLKVCFANSYKKITYSFI